MKGRNTFTKVEAEDIKRLLDRIIELGSYDSLTIANKPRNLYKFFISDFKTVGRVTKKYSSVDFDANVLEGKITVT